MKTGAIILSLFAATGLAIPMEQSQQAKDAQMMDQSKMMQQMQMAANGLFDPPRSGNGNIIGDIFDTAACIFGSFVGGHSCPSRVPSSTTVNITGDDHRNDNANASTSASYQYSYSTDGDGNYHIQINPGGNKPNCNYTVSKDDAAVLANTINQLATKCLSK